MGLLALRGGAVVTDPSKPAVDDGAVVIDGSRIAAVGSSRDVAIPAEAEVLDCSGGTLTTGFWNSHVHLTERKWSDAAAIPALELTRQLEDFSRYGFTSVFDLSSSRDNTKALRGRIESGEIAGPRIYSTAEGIVPAGGKPPELIARVMGWMPVELHEAADARGGEGHVLRLLARGADAIKIFASTPSSLGSPVLGEDVIRAIAACAHASKMPVFAHPNTRDDVSRAVSGKVDVLAHTVPRDGMPVDEFAELAAKGVALTPTLRLWHHMMRHDRVSLRDAVVDRSIAQLRAFHDAGGDVLFGTDHGAVDPDPTQEYRLMAEAGMSFWSVLASLTTAPCRRFDPTRSGTIEAGQPADIVVLNGSVSRGAALFADVRLTIREGRIIYPAV